MSYHHRSVSQSSSPHFDAAHQQQSTASRRHFKFPPQSTTSSTFTKSLSRNYNDSALLMAVDSNIASIYTGGHRGSASLQQKKHSTRTYETSPPSTERNAPESFFPSPEQEFDPIRNGALQFVPAYNKNKQRITNTALEEVASWDAILSDDEKKKEQTPPQPKATNGTASCSGNGSFASFQRRYTDAAERSSVVGQGGRISRIKSLFSSRATVRGGAEATTTAVFSASIPPPPSPVHSNSGSNSSTYVRWPGTQDPNGRTVLVSSYDDSSVGLPPSQQPKDVVPVKAKMDEMKYADQQISQWTANTSASTNVDDEVESLDDCPSPIRANSCSPLYARNMLNTSALSNNTEDGLPQSAADFHLAAAIADARAAEKAQRGQSLSSSSFRGGAHIKSETAVRRNTMDDVDLLRQAVPLTRNKASIATSSHHPYNGGGSANRRGQSFTDASSSAAKVSFVASRSLPPGPSFSSSQVWPAGNTNNTVESEFESNLSPASKTSSAYFNDRDMAAMHLEFPDFDYYNSNNNTGGGDEMLPFRGHGSAASYSVASRPYSSDQPHNAVAAAAKAVGHYSTEMSSKATLQPPTRGALEKNDSFSAPQRNFATLTSKGFGALLDKSKEVPSLMDNFDSDSMSSSKVTTVVSSVQSYSGLRGSRSFAAKPSRVNTSDQDDDVESMSDVFEGLSVSRESDVFDNLSFGELRSTPRKVPSGRPIVLYPERILEEDDVDHKISSFAKEPPSTDGSFNLISLGGGLTAIQTTQSDFLNRRTASDFDGNLSVSDVSSNGYAKIPGFNAMISAGKNRDSSLRGIQGNFGIQPRPRPPSAQSPRDYGPAKSDYNSDSDSSSSSRRSSLFSDPYRSESGLEVFGDLSEYYVQPSLMKKVLRKYRSLSDAKVATMDYSSYENEEDDRKSFALFEMRSRIMEKDIERGLERRGGSFVVDDIATTPYARAAHRIRDAVIVSKAWRDGATISDVVNSALLTRRHQRSHFIERAPDGNRSGGFAGKKHPCSWEAVRWIDDTDMTQYRCPSLGSRHMRGFEMFTIGDCQSILLKLTNDRCQVRFLGLRIFTFCVDFFSHRCTSLLQGITS